MPLEVENGNAGALNGNSHKNGQAKNGVKIRKNNHSFSSTSSSPPRTSSPTFSIAEA